MDVLPEHLNRDSFRDSFKGLVALEIILDLPFGFPINNIISRDLVFRSVFPYVYVSVSERTRMYVRVYLKYTILQKYAKKKKKK